jgi:hypothetical protein
MWNYLFGLFILVHIIIPITAIAMLLNLRKKIEQRDAEIAELKAIIRWHKEE